MTRREVYVTEQNKRVVGAYVGTNTYSCDSSLPNVLPDLRLRCCDLDGRVYSKSD